MQVCNIGINKSVVEFGEFGTTFYIILSGQVKIKIPILCKPRRFTFKELCEYILVNRFLIINDDFFTSMLEEVYQVLPETVNVSKKGTYSLNYEILSEFLSGERELKSMRNCNYSFPRFSNLDYRNKLPSEVEPTHEFELTMLNEVGTLSEGDGFGELALINNTPRSATIITQSD